MKLTEKTKKFGIQNQLSVKINNCFENKLIFSVLLSIIMLLYASIYFNNTFPFSEGWNVNYAELVLHGKMPYRDFYYYLPPLNIGIDVLLWKLSFGYLLIYRFWWLAQRILIFQLIYYMLARYYKPAVAFGATAFGSVLSTASIYDLFGDYNQTQVLLSVLLIYCVIGFWNASKAFAKYRNLVFSGILIALMLLNKQTVFLATCLVYFTVLTLSSYLKKDKNYFKYIMWIAIGFIVIALPVAVLMLATETLIPFVQQVFLETSGKGGLFSIIFSKVFKNCFSLIPFVTVFSMLLILHFGNTGKKTVFNPMQLFCILVLVLLIIYQNSALNLINSIDETIGFQIVAVGCAMPLFLTVAMRLLHKGPEKLRSNRAILSTVVFWCVIFLFGGYWIDSSRGKVIGKLHSNASLFHFTNGDFYRIVFLTTLSLLIYRFYKNVKNGDNKNLSLLWITAGAFSLMYTSVMASPGEFPYYGVTIAVPLMPCEVLSLVNKDKLLELSVRSCALILCAVMSFSCVAQKYNNSYSWWGSSSSPKNEKTYSLKIPALRGFRLDKETAESYKKITTLIKKYTDEDSTVYGFPHIKIFNVLTENYNFDTFVPVMFYDVVADKYVRLENELLKENLPDILLLQEIPKCMDSHEDLFRNGEKLEQRKTWDFFEEITKESYIKVARCYKISVYRKLNAEEQTERDEELKAEKADKKVKEEAVELEKKILKEIKRTNSLSATEKTEIVAQIKAAEELSQVERLEFLKSLELPKVETQKSK